MKRNLAPFRPGRLPGLLAVALLLMGLLAPAALAADSLDQQQEVVTGSTGIPGGLRLAQVVTPGLTGHLTRVEIQISNPSSSIDLAVSVQGVNEAGQPDGAVLASESLTLAAGGARWVEVAFAAPAPVTAGSPVALVLAPSGSMGWSSASTKPYAGGRAWADLGGWVEQQVDFLFRTYVGDPPTPTLSLSSGKVTGGGWIWEDAEARSKGHFALDLKAGAEGLQGSAHYRFRGADGLEYRLEAVELLDLALDLEAGTAAVRARAVLWQIDPEGEAPIASQEGYLMELSLQDGPDGYTIRVTDPAGELWHEAGGPLGGGQVKLHGTEE
ncbi:MAG: hypothetical protein ACOY93_21475 [Bacillota bacterium]